MRKRKKVICRDTAFLLDAKKRQEAAENAHTDAADRLRRRRSKTSLRAAFCYARDQDYSADHALSIGSMSVECQHCHARIFQKDPLRMYCGNGKTFFCRHCLQHPSR